MIKKIFQFKNFLKIIIFFPLTFYFGDRSLIAFDEGFYVLQAKWILEKDNWTIPLWWDEYILDRTIGLQFLIAKSQEIFGKNMFSIYLPTTIAAIIMLFLTYKLHEELLDKKFAIVSPLILSTTYLWFDYSHLATQDIIYSCLVTTGIYCIVKAKNKNDKLYISIFGVWIGLAFMMKTFLVAIPLLSLSPYLFTKKKLLTSKFFWMGLLVGFIPYLVWMLSINSYLDRNIIFYLSEKVNSLSNRNTFTKPFYYYFWNIPATFLPWSIFSIIGVFCNLSKCKDHKLILSFFPLILVMAISFYSTKTPYYPLQISSILSLNSFVGIEYLVSSRKCKSIFLFFTSKVVPLLILCTVFIYYFSEYTSNLSNKENSFLTIGLIFFALSWTFIKNSKKIKEILVPLIIGPYLLTSFLLQSGLFTDRSREIRETMEYLSNLEIVKDQTIKVDKSSINNSEAQSKIIRISLLTKDLGEGINNIKELNSKEVAWSTESKENINNRNSYKVIFENKNLDPWKLVKKD